MRRTLALLGLSTLTLGGLVGVAGPADAAAALPANCARSDDDDISQVVCTWTSGIGNRFTVPAGVTEVSMIAIGAPGGSTRRFDFVSTVPGGRGGVGVASASFAADAGSRLLLVDVGAPGQDGYNARTGAGSGAGGAPGGGSAGVNGFLSTCGAGGGGGYSAVRRPSAVPVVDTRIVVGGGGGGSTGCGVGQTGFGADAGANANRAAGGGGAGTRTAGGAGGTSTDPDAAGRPGRLRSGGSSPAIGGDSGGGGGGGLYGGGSGASAATGGGGGGGSSTGGSRMVSGGPAVVTIFFRLPLS